MSEMQTKRCRNCFGSGIIMGGGCIQIDCPECFGKGMIEEPKDDIDFLVNKQNESYQAAKKRLMKKHKSLSSEEAEKLLDDALEKEREKN